MENEVEAKSKLCTIFTLSDGEKSLFGCGCVVKSSDQNLRIATSQKIFELWRDVEIFAKFEDQNLEIKLQFPTKVEEIAYLPLDDTASPLAQLPDGFFKAEIEDVDAIACFVPVLDKLESFGNKEGKISFYEAVRHAEKCSLERKIGNNKRSLARKLDFQTLYLEVLGSPILSEDAKFLGIVDFLELANNESLLRIIYHDGIQKTFVTGGGLPQQGRVIAQETDSGSDKLSPGARDSLAKLWNKNIDFRDEFCKVLDVKYSEIKYWPHLADKFGIDKNTYDTFSTSDKISPTESLFEHLAATQPDFNIGQLRKSLEDTDAQEVYLIVKESVEAGDLSEEDLVTEMCDKAPKVLDTITLKLDREDRLWKDLARERGIFKRTYSSFESDRTDNPTRLLFDCLAAEGPHLNIKNFKDKLIKLNKNDLLEGVFKKLKISDEMPLRDLSKYPDVMSDIESNLNKTDALWKLARLYQQEDSLMEDVDIVRRFRQKKDCHSPTRKMMEYVLASLSAQQYTIKDLVIKLKTIKRNDCFPIIAPYLKGGMDDIEKITKGLENLRVEPRCEGRKEPSTGDDNSTSNVSASDEGNNPYLKSTVGAVRVGTR